jgi:hypothetical protein
MSWVVCLMFTWIFSFDLHKSIWSPSYYFHSTSKEPKAQTDIQQFEQDYRFGLRAKPEFNPRSICHQKLNSSKPDCSISKMKNQHKATAHTYIMWYIHLRYPLCPIIYQLWQAHLETILRIMCLRRYCEVNSLLDFNFKYLHNLWGHKSMEKGQIV